MNARITLLALLTALIVAFPAGARAQVGLLGLHPGRDAADVEKLLQRLDPELNARGCVLRRRGSIFETSGKLDLPAAASFVLFECAASMLDLGSDRSDVLIGGEATSFVWLEGILESFLGLTQPAPAGRLYVIKMSRFNNLDVGERYRSLASLNLDAARREHGFRNEAVIEVHRAAGIEAPDEVTLLYYDSDESAKAFREENTDILKRIGRFNRTHLVDFKYLNASHVQ